MVRCFLLAACAPVLAGAARVAKRTRVEERAGSCPPVTTQPNFDLDQYISRRWYVQEQMLLEDTIPADGNNCVTARYSRKSRPTFWGWDITVENRAVFDDGTPRGGDICATGSDPHDPAKLTVAPCFLPTFAGGPYWVLAYDEAEGYALISGGQPENQFEGGCRTGNGTYNSGLWIFSRVPFPPAGLVEKVRGIAAGQGFDLSVLVPVRHSDCSGFEGYEESPQSAALLAEAARMEEKTRVQKTGSCPPVRTQPNFDLEQYISRRWYAQEQMNIEYLPANGNNCVTAMYSRKSRPTFWGWEVTVENRAVYDDGTPWGGDICAKSSDPHDPAKLTVAPCFLPTFAGGPYWVLAYDEAEGYALVSGGQPENEVEGGCRTGTGVNNAGLWIFTRVPSPPAGLVEKVRGLAADQGFDLSVLAPVRQSNCTGFEGYEDYA